MGTFLVPEISEDDGIPRARMNVEVAGRDSTVAHALARVDPAAPANSTGAPDE